MIKSTWLSDHLSVFSAEFFVVVLAIEWIIEFNPLSAVIFSNSLSGLKALESLQSGCRQDLVLEVLHLLDMAIWRGTVIDLCWIPAHMGRGGNEACDQAAKRAQRFDLVTPNPSGPIKTLQFN